MGNFHLGKSIKTQLIVLLFALSAVSITVVGFLGVRALLNLGSKAEDITATVTQARAEQFLEQTTTATADKNSVVFKNIQDEITNVGNYTSNVFSNPGSFTTSWLFDSHVKRNAAGQYVNGPNDLANVLIGPYSPPTPAMKQEIQLLHNLDYLAPQTLKNESNAVALYFIGNSGESFYYPNIDLSSIVPPDLNPTTLNFYTVGTPTNDPSKAMQWTDVYDDPAGNGLTITASQPVYTGDTFSGVMSMDISLNAIAKNIESYSPIESSYAFLIDKAGRAVALPAQGYKDILSRSQRKGEFGPDLQKVSGQFGAVLTDMRKGKNGFAEVQANKSDLFVAYQPLSGTNFSLGIVARKSVLLQVVSDLQTQVKSATRHVLYLQILPIAVLILALVWILGYFYIRLIAGPITVLTEKVNRIAQSSFQEEISVKTRDNEVGKLAAAFNKMSRDLAASYRALQNKVVEVGNAKAKDDAILNSIGDGVIVTDEAGNIVLLNSIAAELYALDPHKAIGKPIGQHPIHDLNNQPISVQERPITLAITTGKRVSRDITTIDSKGVHRTLSLTATPVIQAGKVSGSVEILHDVTREKEIERNKTEFITIASHQLRTPLSAIKWFGELLASDDKAKLSSEQSGYVESINASAQRMAEIVDALLSISSLEGGSTVLDDHTTDIKQFVSKIVSGLQPRADKQKLKLVVDIPDDLPKTRIASREVTQLYANLLTNAIKYTPKDGTVSLSIRHKDNDLITEISDTGYGIPKAEQRKVFQKFFRGTNVQQVDTDGTGLGLFLVKAIVDSSGGKIWFESKEGKGTTMTFTLPVISGPDAPAGGSGAAAKAPAAPKNPPKSAWPRP